MTGLPDRIVIRPSQPLAGRVAAPASKSTTNRLLVLAALASGTSELVAPLQSDDTQAMRTLLDSLGVGVGVHRDGDETRWRVEGGGGRLHPRRDSADVGLSGTTLRFGVALAAISHGRPLTVTGAPPLLQRPVGPLTAALRQLGADDRRHATATHLSASVAVT